MKKMISILLILMMILSLSACGEKEEVNSGETTQSSSETTQSSENKSVLPEDGPTFNLVLAHGAPEQSDGHKGTLVFKELIEERSGGKITVDSYPGFQLGSVQELIQNQKSGQIAMTVGTAGGSTSKAIAFLDLPALYSDIGTATAVVAEGTKARALIDQEYGKLNVKVLSVMPITYRQTSSNVKVTNVDEFKGLKIRTMENPIHMAFWHAIGANPTPLPFSELYVALQQGLVDAQENPLDTIYNAKLYEQANYIIKSNHVMFYNAYTINRDIWNQMPPEYQQLMKETMADVEKWIRETTDKSLANFEKKLVDAGLEIIEFSDADFAKMTELAKPVFEKVRELSGDEVIDEILTTVGVQ